MKVYVKELDRNKHSSSFKHKLNLTVNRIITQQRARTPIRNFPVKVVCRDSTNQTPLEYVQQGVIFSSPNVKIARS